ncbi:Hypothetical protein SCF082_LOCUS20325 [Durusdinium trenchii]|uniref:Uncharacterized protein n=1 Tax=Durusdinium trenchii TaxID=1381693 RepID=A0ABP0L4A3_9DINO
MWQQGFLEGLLQGMPPLATGFTWFDLARAVSFLIKLAQAEGLESAVEEGESQVRAAKKPRLTHGAEAAAVFMVMLDYILSTAVEGAPFTVSDEIADGATCLELALRGLLLAACLSRGPAFGVIKRAEALLLGGSSCLRGGRIGNRMRRLGARVLGALAKQAPGTSTLWLRQLDASLADSSAEKRAAAALGVCELLREGVDADDPAKTCHKVLSFLVAPQMEQDIAALTAACDGLRRLSERKPLVWNSLEQVSPQGQGKDVLLNRVYGLSTPMMEANSEVTSAHTTDLVYASWRFIGQLAAWDGEGEQCLDKLISIGQRDISEEALAAMGLALCAAISNPSEPQGEVATFRAGGLMHRLLKMAGDEKSDREKVEEHIEDGAASLARKRALAAERDAEQRCGVTWLAILVRQMAQNRLSLPEDTTLSLSRAFVRSISGLSMFVADCGLKSLCNLYRLVTAEARPEFLKALFSSISNRTVVSNMFVGTPDTQARKEEKDSKDSGGPNSWKIAAKERVDMVKDLMFLARELMHPPLFIGLLDQPSGSVWTGEIMREALDLQAWR